LLLVAGRPMIEHVLATVEQVKEIDAIHLVTNAKFVGHFESWMAGYRKRHPKSPPIIVTNDRSTGDDDKLGAIGDIDLIIRQHQIDDDLLVVGGDNLFTDTLERFVSFARSHGATTAVYDVGNLELIRQYNNIEFDAEGRITSFEEKPSHPRNTVTGICVYYYPRQTLPLIERYMAEGNNPDQPGRLVAWLYTRQPVFVFPIRGKWIDIGTPAQLDEANRVFS
jgi:glucose-1-phosphate thymidylyltransferase